MSGKNRAFSKTGFPAYPALKTLIFPSFSGGKNRTFSKTVLLSRQSPMPCSSTSRPPLNLAVQRSA
ncbi:MAG: hypothetical protein EB003_11525 [Flavobacteriia bacterium]|nr:hypothetical protein [Flavobacteriia bacterium]